MKFIVCIISWQATEEDELINQRIITTYRVSAGIMRQFVLWDTACNFNDVIQKS